MGDLTIQPLNLSLFEESHCCTCAMYLAQASLIYLIIVRMDIQKLGMGSTEAHSWFPRRRKLHIVNYSIGSSMVLVNTLADGTGAAPIPNSLPEGVGSRTDDVYR